MDREKSTSEDHTDSPEALSPPNDADVSPPADSTKRTKGALGWLILVLGWVLVAKDLGTWVFSHGNLLEPHVTTDEWRVFASVLITIWCLATAGALLHLLRVRKRSHQVPVMPRRRSTSQRARLLLAYALVGPVGALVAWDVVAEIRVHDPSLERTGIVGGWLALAALWVILVRRGSSRSKEQKGDHSINAIPPPQQDR